MNNFRIESAQNVHIEQNAAGLLDRILAFLIDGILLLLFAVGATIAMNSLGLTSSDRWVYSLVVFLPFLLYHLLFESLWNGRSPGKAALRLRVVKLDGTNPAFSDFLLRWVLRIVDITLSSGSVAVVTILLNGKGQRLGDLAAGTSVISEKRHTNFRDTLHIELPKDYQPGYPQVTVFNDREIQTIKNLYSEAKTAGNHRIILSLSEKTAAVMQVTPAEKPMQFLERVLADYNFYTQN